VLGISLELGAWILELKNISLKLGSQDFAAGSMKIRTSPHWRWANQTTCRMYRFSLPKMRASHEMLSTGPDPGLHKSVPRPFTG
jgi:hypothetical protein